MPARSPFDSEMEQVVPFPTCSSCPISKYALYEPTLTSAPQTFGSQRVQVSTYKANRPILRQSEVTGLFGSMRSGWACRYTMLSNGRRQILGFLIPGDTLILEQLHTGARPLPYGISALTTVTVCWVPLDFMIQLTRKGDAQEELTQLWMLYFYRTITRRAAAIGRSSATAKLAELLLELFTRLKHRNIAKGDGYYFAPTQSQIGDCLGLTPVHVNRVLANLTRRGVLEIKDKTIRVFNENELLRISEED